MNVCCHEPEDLSVNKILYPNDIAVLLRSDSFVFVFTGLLNEKFTSINKGKRIEE